MTCDAHDSHDGRSVKPSDLRDQRIGVTCLTATGDMRHGRKGHSQHLNQSGPRGLAKDLIGGYGWPSSRRLRACNGHLFLRSLNQSL